MKVIVAERAEREAYEMGYERFEDQDSRGEVDADLDLTLFRDSAAYTNYVLPSLRALAGYEDGGHGTYTIGGEIAIVDEADLDDTPIEAETWTAGEYLDVLVDRWTDGARDACLGNEEGESL